MQLWANLRGWLETVTGQPLLPERPQPAVSPTRRRRATGAEPANSQGSHIVKKPRAHSAVAMGAIVSIEIAVFLDHLRRFDEPHIDRALVVATAVAFAITS